jgi:cell division protein FtsW
MMTPTLTRGRRSRAFYWDPWLAGLVLSLMAIGLVTVTSASIPLAEERFGDPLHYAKRQTVYLILGLIGLWLVSRIPLTRFQQRPRMLLGGAFALLTMVLIPGVGTEINGSTRWIDLMLFHLQVSEPAKLLVVLFLAAYLARHQEYLPSSTRLAINPLITLLAICCLLLLEPDLGTSVILMTVGLILLFLAGLNRVAVLATGAVAMAVLAGLIVSAPYRVERWFAFLDPWAHVYDSSYQLVQSLIAIGNGGVSGQGIGGSVMKLAYLPEAHTDFIFAVFAEETGMIGSLLLITLYWGLLLRALQVGRIAIERQRPFAAYTAYGIGLLLGTQAFINIAVNLGVLPTKGLTLPLVSYGGSSLVVTCLGLGLLFRIAHENRCRDAIPRGNP